MQAKVLIVTGGFLTLKESSIFVAVQKQLSQLRASEHSWLETKIKLTTAFPVLFEANENFDTPELTEVVLCGILHDHGTPYEIATYDDLFSGRNDFDQKLNTCAVVFASTTFLRDLSELDPILDRLKHTDNRIVLGGAMAGSMTNTWQGHKLVDLIAIGYGEYLIPQICHWIKSGYTQLKAPPTGRLEERDHSTFIFSGVPPTLSLDHLPRPDWSLSQKDHSCTYKMVHYESVRGCPYRCSFCNYPFLFDDTKFRTKSAKKMAQDWLYYKNAIGMEFITCLDSLFTMPRKRLIEFCQQLIELEVKVKWICYARADDLCDEATVSLMKEAGAHQVQIGIESGEQLQLDNMNKRTRVESNALAIDNCRKAGLTTVVTLIVGFPGETQKSIVLNQNNRQRFGLVTMQNERTVSPYWAHNTMDCLEATTHQWQLSEKLIANRVSLDAAIFYKGILRYDPKLRDDMLSYQSQCVNQHDRLYSAINVVRRWCDKRLARDLQSTIGSQPTPLVDIPAQPIVLRKKG